MHNRHSRRQFLQMTGITTAATALAPAAQLFRVPTFAQGPKSLTIGINSLLNSLDPHASAGPSNIGNRLFGLMFDALRQFDVAGQPIAQLATAWENDGTAWRFTLRDGVKFHDGSMMAADDVVASFQRMIDPALEGSFGSGRLTPFLASIEKIDDLTVQFNTTAIDPVFPLRVTFHQAAVMPKAFLESADATTLRTWPIGAGPYKVVEFTPEHIALEVHSEYWGGRPAADEVIVRLVPENETRVGALQSGEVDLITNVPYDQLSLLEADNNFSIAVAALNNYMSVLFNCTAGPTADVNLRHALSLSIDRETIVNEVFGGRYGLLNDYLLPSTFGYDPSQVPFPYDPNTAAEALAASNYDGEVLSFTPITNYYVNSELYTPVINEMWRAIGINTDFQPQEPSAYIQTLRGGTLQAALQSWGSSGDALFSLYSSWATPGLYRPGLYSPPAEFDSIYANLTNNVRSVDERYAGIRQLTDIVYYDAPTAPLFQTTDFFATRAGISFQAGPEFYIDLRPGNFSM